MVKVVKPPVTLAEQDGEEVVINTFNNASRIIIAAGNGVFLRTVTPLWTVVQKLPDKYLPGISEHFDINIQKLPIDYLRRAHKFARQVEAKYKSEVSILYFYNPETKHYLEYVPKQKVTSTSVKYEVPEEVHKEMSDKGYALIGTIHSHPTFGASQSGTDHKDEITLEGWHITIGHVNRAIPDYHARWFLAGVMRECKLEDIVDLSLNEDIPEEWINNVEEKKLEVVGFKQPVVGTYYQKMPWSGGYSYGDFHPGDEAFNPIKTNIGLFTEKGVEISECTIESI